MFGVKMYAGFWTKKKISTWLRTHLKRCQPGRQGISFCSIWLNSCLGWVGKGTFFVGEFTYLEWLNTISWRIQIVNSPVPNMSTSTFSCELRRSFSATCDGLFLPHSCGTFLWLRIIAVTWAPISGWAWDSNGLVPKLKYVGFKKQDKNRQVWKWFIGSLFIGPRFLEFFVWFLLHRFTWWLGDGFGCYKRI